MWDVRMGECMWGGGGEDEGGVRMGVRCVGWGVGDEGV